MSNNAMKIVSDLMEAWNSHDVERVAAFYAADYEGVDVSQAEPQRGLAGVRQMVTRYWQAFPDLQFSSDQIVIQDDRAVLVWTARGTHRGRLMNIPPTERKIQVHGVSVLTLNETHVTHGLYIWDVAGLLRAIGLLPDL